MEWNGLTDEWTNEYNGELEERRRILKVRNLKVAEDAM